MSTEVRVSVHDAGPGTTILAFEVPPDEPLLRLNRLLERLEKWRKQNPDRIIADFEIVRDRDSTVRSLHLTWHV